MITFCVLAVLGGSLAGILSSIWFGSYAGRYGKRLIEESRPPRLGEARLSSAPSQYLDALSTVQEKTARTLVVWERKMSVSDAGYSLSNALGVGVLLSEDGWAVAPASVLSVRDATKMVGIVDQARVFSVSQAVADPVLPLVYVKLNGNGMSAIPFARSANLSKGEWVFAAQASGLLSSSMSGWMDLPPSPVEAEAREERFLTFPSLEENLPVFNRAGELLGFSQGQGRVLPMEFFDTTVQSLLRGEPLSWARLGLWGIEQSPLVVEEMGRGTGFVVTDVRRATPAFIAGMKRGDRIMRINGEAIQYGQSMGMTLAGFRPGARIKVSFVRGDGEQEIELVLDAKP